MKKNSLTIRGCTTVPNRVHSGSNATQGQAIRWNIPISLLILVMSLLGCSRPSQPISSTGGIDYTTVEMWASSDCVQPGEHVQLRATVTNKGSQTQVVDLKDQPVLDIVFGNPGNPFRRWSNGRPLAPELTQLELKPGEFKTIEMDWVPDASIQGPIHIWALFLDRRGAFPTSPSVTVGVKYCPGPLSP
ncbi:MAG: hypothetical protein HY782_04680 [Chloroflexi bacterium]|nr:hypothetical protein [Chloroflexota bacterium]